MPINTGGNIGGFNQAFLNLLRSRPPITEEKGVESATQNEKAQLRHHETVIDKIEEIWERTENNNNSHRTNIVGIVFGLIVAEVVIISCLIFMSPFVTFPKYLIEIFSTAIIAQTFGLVKIMLQYLFNNKDDKFLEAISNIYKSNPNEKKMTAD